MLNLSTNKVNLSIKIKALNQLDLPFLKRLNLNENEISTCEDFNGHDSLEFIDLSKNKLKTLKGLCNMPKLTDLYLVENEIQSILELENLPSLLKLNLR